MSDHTYIDANKVYLKGLFSNNYFFEGSDLKKS